MTATTADAPVDDTGVTTEPTEPTDDQVDDAGTTQQQDLGVILPEPGAPKVIGDIEIRVKHLRAREFFKLMGIITNGVGPAMSSVDFKGASSEELQGTFASLLIMAIPNAVDEFVSLCQEIVEPTDDRYVVELRQHLRNPEIEDLFPIVDGIIENEAENIAALVGKARAYFAKWQETFRKQKFR